MIRVGLTGGIGSGKSTVARCFQEFGIPVYYADDEAKKLMHSSKVIRKRLVSEFGDAVYEKNELNRQYLASLIFNDPEKLKTINSIVHPEVRNHFAKWVKKQDAPYVIQENAILLENDFRTQFDCIILVIAPEQLKMERLIQKGIKKEDILNRMKNQWPDERKILLADFLIENVDLKHTRQQVKELHKKLLNFSL